jgi:hypothetical protein
MIAEALTVGGFMAAAAEVTLYGSLHRWAAVAGVRMFKLSGRLPAERDVAQLLPTLGFRVRELGGNRYLVRPVSWWAPGRSADLKSRDGIGVLRVRDSSWQLDVRAGIGLPVAFVGVLGLGYVGALYRAVWGLCIAAGYAWVLGSSKTAFLRLARGLEEAGGRPTTRCS